MVLRVRGKVWKFQLGLCSELGRDSVRGQER